MNGTTPAAFLHDECDSFTQGLSDEELERVSPRCTDAANADALRDKQGAGYRYVVQWDAWLSWDGKRWRRQGATVRLTRAAVLCARECYAETKAEIDRLTEEKRVAALTDEDKADAIEERIKYQRLLLKWHEQSQNAAKVNACIQILRTLLTVELPELDASPWLFNCDNGTIDLRTGDLLPYTHEHYITQMSGVSWDDSAECPTWNAFLRSAMGGDTLLTCYLARVVGYALTASTEEHALFFMWGGGRNGKSTFLRTVQALFGEYGCAAPRDLLFQPRGGGVPHPTELARLYGRRLAVGAELGEHHRFDEAKVKDLTGGDVIACRRMNEDWWDFTPTHTLFLAGNHKPTVSGDDLGIWRRMRLIHWGVAVAESDVDSELPSKLLRELPGILRWAVHGCLEWHRLGLSEPPSVIAATEAYRKESDVLGAFLSQHCVFDRSEMCTGKDLRELYERWCKDNGHEPLGGRRLATRLRETGAVECNVRKGQRTFRGWRGVRLRNESELFESAEPDTSSAQN
jgi:putative DNA primase/helicase